jgi:hypothetical protein
MPKAPPISSIIRSGHGSREVSGVPISAIGFLEGGFVRFVRQVRRERQIFEFFFKFSALKEGLEEMGLFYDIVLEITIFPFVFRFVMSVCISVC